jgi:hypothetical protein
MPKEQDQQWWACQREIMLAIEGERLARPDADSDAAMAWAIREHLTFLKEALVGQTPPSNVDLTPEMVDLVLNMLIPSSNVDPVKPAWPHASLSGSLKASRKRRPRRARKRL